MRVDTVPQPADRVRTPPRLRIRLEGHEPARTRLRRERVLNAHVLLREATSAGGDHLPIALRRDLLAALGPRGRRAYQLLGGARGSFCPSAAVPQVSEPAWADAARDAVVAASADQVRHEITDAFGAAPLPPGWERIVQEPRPWLRAIGAAFVDTAAVVERFWRVADARLGREARRLDHAMGLTGEDWLGLTGLSDHLGVTPGELQVAGRCDVSIAFTGDIIVAPVVAPPEVRLVIDRGPHLLVLYSAMPGHESAAARGRAAGDRLGALLGPTRATALLALDRPMTMGDLAGRLAVAPSTATHHLRRLVDGGLVTSRRRGQFTVVERTMVGQLLVELLAD